jgi:rare lipoprotein A
MRLGEERGATGRTRIDSHACFARLVSFACFAGLDSFACFARIGALAAVSLVLANCSGSSSFGSLDPRYGVSSSARVVAPGEPIPKGGGNYRVGAPYSIGGRVYTPEENPNYRAEGVASWYGEDFHGRLTANGEVFDMHSMSAAHPTMPLPSYARVTNLSTHKSVIVRVNDRGPYSGDRLIDVSVRAANLLGFYGSGLAPVRVEYVGRAPLEGSDDNMLMATLRQGEPAPTPSLVRVASAKPFVPAAVSRAALRDVPTPPDRPYGLGEGQMVSNFRPGREAQQASGTAVARARDADPPTRAPPALSAYAPARPDLQRGDVPYASAMRGLY